MLFFYEKKIKKTCEKKKMRHESWDSNNHRKKRQYQRNKKDATTRTYILRAEVSSAFEKELRERQGIPASGPVQSSKFLTKNNCEYGRSVLQRVNSHSCLSPAPNRGPAPAQPSSPAGWRRSCRGEQTVSLEPLCQNVFSLPLPPTPDECHAFYCH